MTNVYTREVLSGCKIYSKCMTGIICSIQLRAMLPRSMHVYAKGIQQTCYLFGDINHHFLMWSCARQGQ